MRIHQITEAPRRTATIAFGRMNPPTIGHAKVVAVVKSQGGDPYIFLSQSQKPKTDPLSFEQKLGFAKAFFPGVNVGDPEVRTIFEALIKVYKMGYTDLVYVAGSDRVTQFTDLINKYNGQEDQYTFDSIQVVSAGERDPDAEGAEGMSASKMRAAAAAGEFEAFKSGTPNPDMAQSMYDAVRNGMGVTDQEPVPDAAGADGMMESLEQIIQVTGTLRRLDEVKPLNENVKNKLKSVLEAWSATYEAKLSLPDLETGDELMVGKFKNRKATIKDFTKDKHNQPVAVTDKGEQQIFKGRVKKLMPTEGKSPHRKGTTKYKNHMAAMHAGMNEAAQDIAEDGIIVKGVNTTPDVGPNEIKVQANKMGFKVDKGGRPPLLHTKAAKNSDPNTLFNLGLTESVDYVKPQFDVEWEEANRYPYLEKLGQAGWEELAGAGKVITVNTNSVKNIDNTGADGSEALDDLEPEKVARLKQAMDAGTIEMPIVVKQSDGSYSLVAGNTRLIGLITTYGKAKVWLVDASNLAEGQLTERGSIGVPLSSGITVGIAPHRELNIKKSTPGKLSYNENVEVDISGNAEKGYVLSKIVVPKELRGTGVGSKIMQDLINKADMEGAIIALTPDTAFGGSKGRLIQFYKSFGFVPNKGRNKDFRYRETMIRYPKT